MNKYIGTKLVDARPMNRGEYNEYRGWTIPKDENPADEGFLVKYHDNYESWSPKDVFEEAYRPTSGLTFGLALEAAKKGKRIARAGWNGKDQWVELGKNFSYHEASGLCVATHHCDIGSQALVFCGTRGRQVGWLASQSDMLAEDWMVLEEV
jgi:hypothetical protein